MNFLNPAILFGMLAASIPLILHLLNLRRLKRVEFSSLKFIKELQKTKIRRVKLKQILLLILRTLLIAFIVLAFSRPTIESNLPLIGTYAKSSIVILLDNSFSMDASDEYGNRFKQAKHAAETILRSMKQGDDAMVIAMSEQGNNHYMLSTNPEQLAKDLGRIVINYPSAALEKSLAEAYKVLNQSDNLNQEIYIISDAQENTFKLSTKDSLGLYNPKARIYYVNVGAESKTEISNYSIDSLNIATQIIQQDKPVEVEAMIRNNTTKDIEGLVVSLFYNEKRISQQAVDIEGEQSVSINMKAEAREFGVVRGYLEIESDALEYDNRRYFGYLIPEKPNIAIFGTKRIRFPFEALLNLNADKISLTAYEASQIASIDLTRHDLIIITDGADREIYFEKIRTYLENGGSAMMFANNETTNPQYIKQLRKLDIEIQEAVEYSADNPLEFNYTDKNHPLFDGVFPPNKEAGKRIESAIISKIYPSISGQKIIGTPAGNFLSEFRIGSGRFLFISSSADLNWSNFSLTGLFPVIIFRSAFYLTSTETFGKTIETGEQARIIINAKNGSGKRFKIIDPKGIESYQEAVQLPTSKILELQNTDEPGVYSIISESGKVMELLTVNHDPSESNIRKMEEEDISGKLNVFTDQRTEIEFLNRDKIVSGFNRARTGTELWQLFIILAILTALTEMIVARTTKNDIVGE